MIKSVLSKLYIVNIIFTIVVNSQSLMINPIFQNNMVIQKGKSLSVTGTSKPNTAINLSFNNIELSSVSDDSGKWLITIEPLDYGKPFDIKISSGDEKIILKNVVVGEVWLCSGQSNMDWRVRNSMNADLEIENAVFPDIRIMTVEKVTSIDLKKEFNGNWEVCSPENVGDFSAAGYFFGKELHNNLNVPIGLIHSSWGGTPIESWISKESLESDPELISIIKNHKKNIESYPEKLIEYKKLLDEVKSKNIEIPVYQVDKCNKGYLEGWANNDFDDSEWLNIKLPRIWESVPNMQIDGAIWFRKQIEIPSSWLNKSLVLELGAIDDFDSTYLNGILVGTTGEDTPNHWATPRKYIISSDKVTSQKFTLAIRVFDHFGDGGFAGSASQMRIYPEGEIYSSVNISGEWKYKIETALNPSLITGPGGNGLPKEPIGPLNSNSPTVLYNAMINPFIEFPIAGVIWYQGEANVTQAYKYRKLLPTMINDWRSKWNDKFYFGIVQLANFTKKQTHPEESNWAELREAQTLSTNIVDYTGIATAIDIGEADDIHPKNKQEVGRRLSLVALSDVYNKNVISSAPVLKSSSIEGNKMILEFDMKGQKFISVGNNKIEGFTIAEENGVFHFAHAEIKNNTITLWSDNLKLPKYVRYMWANNPIGNLYGENNLPVLPFRTDDFPGTTINNE